MNQIENSPLLSYVICTPFDDVTWWRHQSKGSECLLIHKLKPTTHPPSTFTTHRQLQCKDWHCWRGLHHTQQLQVGFCNGVLHYCWILCCCFVDSISIKRCFFMWDATRDTRHRHQSPRQCSREFPVRFRSPVKLKTQDTETLCFLSSFSLLNLTLHYYFSLFCFLVVFQHHFSKRTKE
jgi:hypothetical protein